MSESGRTGVGSGRAGHILLRIAVTLLVLNFALVWLLSPRASVLASLLFVAAMVGTWPPVRRAITASGPLRIGWLRGGLLMTVLLLATWLLETRDTPELERRPRAFVGATVITGEADESAVPDAVVLADDSGTIVAFGPRGAVSIPDDFEVVDVGGRYLMPGLINGHGHLMLSGRDPTQKMELGRFALPDWLMTPIRWLMDSYVGRRLIQWQMERNVRSALLSGVTTLRGLGDPGFLDVVTRDRVAEGERIGPRLLVAGPVLCVTGGHAHQIGLVFDGPDEARRAVRKALSHRVDVIKIASTGGVSDSRRLGEAGELQMTPDEIRAVTDEAHRKNVLVTAHAQSTEGIKEALRAGVDTIEHGAALDEEAIALFLDNPESLRGYSTLHPTLSVALGEMVLDESVREDPVVFVMYQNGLQVREGVIAGFRTALENGIHIGVGTDAGIVSHDAVWRELQQFVDLGDVTPSRAIHMGTLASAQSIGIEDRTGSIARGKAADFIVLARDPRVDLSALAEPELVVAEGVVHRPPH